MSRQEDSTLRVAKRAALDIVAQMDSAVTLSDEPEIEDAVAVLRWMPEMIDELLELRRASRGKGE